MLSLAAADKLTSLTDYASKAVNTLLSERNIWSLVQQKLSMENIYGFELREIVNPKKLGVMGRFLQNIPKSLDSNPRVPPSYLWHSAADSQNSWYWFGSLDGSAPQIGEAYLSPDDCPALFTSFPHPDKNNPHIFTSSPSPIPVRLLNQDSFQKLSFLGTPLQDYPPYKKEILLGILVFSNQSSLFPLWGYKGKRGKLVPCKYTRIEFPEKSPRKYNIKNIPKKSFAPSYNSPFGLPVFTQILGIPDFPKQYRELIQATVNPNKISGFVRLETPLYGWWTKDKGWLF